MIKSRTYTPPAGATSYFHFTFNHVNVLSVDREGLGQTQIGILATPGNAEFKKLSGPLVFSTSSPFTGNEKLQVIYET